MKARMRPNLVADNWFRIDRSNDIRQRGEAERHRSPVRTFKVRKSQNLQEKKQNEIHWRVRITGSEQQKERSLLVRKALNDLPKASNDWVVGAELVCVHRVLLPVLHVNHYNRRLQSLLPVSPSKTVFNSDSVKTEKKHWGITSKIPFKIK